MASITITWDPATGAEPSNCFDGFYDKVVEVSLDVPYDPIQMVWGEMRDSIDGPVILGFEHDPETGSKGEPIDVLLSAVRSVRYL